MKKNFNKKYFISSHNNKILKNIFWISGCSRSGTTLLGKIISTFKNNEYIYEPETLFSILPLVKEIKFEKWKLIYETYVGEDLFYNHLVGRKINLKKIDGSYIGNSKNSKEIYKKLKLNISRLHLNKYLNKNNFHLTIKIPDVVKFLVNIEKFYPKNKFLIIFRNPYANINSLIKKKWFSKKYYDKSFLPYLNNKNKLYPLWLERKFYNVWNSFNEYEKAAFYVATINKEVFKLKNKNLIFYENLLENPTAEIARISKYLSMDYTKKTIEIKRSINKKNLSTSYDSIKLKLRKKIRLQLDADFLKQKKIYYQQLKK